MLLERRIRSSLELLASSINNQLPQPQTSFEPRISSRITESTMISKDEVLDILQETDAMLQGHFLLSSGLHSPVYFQCAMALQHPAQAERLGAGVAELFADLTVDVVISPAVGGIVIGQEVGRALGVRAIFGEREGGRMTLRRGFHIDKGERVLVVDDVMTRGGSVREVLGAVSIAGGSVVGIGVVVDRSGGNLRWDVPLRSLAQLDAVTHQADDCPLCGEKLPLVKPGSRKSIED
jgi:orotate phosphoribosyltransferase